MMKRKYVLSCLLFCTLITDLIHASGFEAPISQATQTIGAAIIAGVATAIAIATEVIRPVAPEKDLPKIQIQEKQIPAQESTPPEIVSSQSKSAPAISQPAIKPEDFQTPIWHPESQKIISQEIVHIHITIQPAPEISQLKIPESQ